MHKRIQKLWQILDKALDGILITSPENVRYLSDFSGTEGSILLNREEGFFLTDGRYTTQAKEQVKNFTIITFKEKWKDLGRLVKKLHLQRLGFEANHLSVASLQDLQKQLSSVTLKPQAEALDSLRTIKSRSEINILKRTAAIASQSLREVMPLVKPGVREREIATELEFLMRKKGGDGPAFQFIVASGPRSALPHGVASDKKIAKGDIVTIDFGTVYRGYSSDETCTFVVGKPTRKQDKIYNIVKEAHDRAIAAVKPGKSFKAIDAVARRYITKQGFEKYFTHGTGHGIGLCVHEPPLVSLRGKGKAQKGMAFTIEPGIYWPGWGGVRLEDTVVVTSNGCEVITSADKTFCLE